MGWAMLSTHNEGIASICSQKSELRHGYHSLNMCVKGEAMISVLSLWVLRQLGNCVNPQLTYWPPTWAKILLMISLPHPEK
jgi:hypothetical protein